MADYLLKLRSSINSSFKRQKLWQGTLLALAGLGILSYTSLFFSVEYLGIWGFPLFCLGIGLISAGLIPYRRLCRLEINPHEIVLLDEVNIKFNWQGKKTLTVPLISVAKTAYLKKSEKNYGIGIWLKQPAPEKVMVHDTNFNVLCFQNDSRRLYGCDLFLPFFSEPSYERLLETINTENQKDCDA